MADEANQLTKDEIEAIRELLKSQLSQDEIKAAREIIQSEQRAKWLWSSIRVWSLWIAGVITALSLAWETIVNIIKAAVGK